MENTKSVAEAAAAFDFSGKEVTKVLKYGSGHISDTFAVFCGTEAEYVIQRVNTEVFKNPEKLIENIAGVTEFLRKKTVSAGGDPNRETLNVIKTKKGKNFFIDSDGGFWRSYLFVKGAYSLDGGFSNRDLYECGLAFGRFQGLLSDYPAETLYETIKDFHNTKKRLDDFLTAVKNDEKGRAHTCREEIEMLMRRAEKTEKTYCQVCRFLPLRVTHNDTKLNNVMFDNVTKKALCVVDLDTVMPGFSINDFGDAVRFGANTALEDETDLSKVSFSVEGYENIAKGFIEGCGGRLTAEEIEMLPDGAWLMTVESALRFLTDYLMGDVYFKIHREGHNLDRCRTQIKLAADMERYADKMRKTVEGECK